MKTVSIIPTCFNSWLVNFFIGCGKDAIVEKPESLRKSIKEALAELYGFY